MSTIGSVEWLRLLGTHEAAKDARGKVEEVTGDWKEAQKLASDREETFDEAMQVVEDNTSASRADNDRVVEAGKDLRRAQKKVEALDRKRRKLVDLDKKLRARVFQILDDITGESGNLKLDGKPAPDAWRHVLLDDILGGPLHSAPYVKAGLKCVGDAKDALEANAKEDASIAALVRAGDINKHQAKWLAVQVASNLNRRGIRHSIEVPKGEIEVPDEVKLPDPKIVPCLNGSYRFKSEDREFTGSVEGGGAKFARVKLFEVVKGDGKRDEVIEIKWPDFELEEIDVPKDAIAIDQQGTPSAASEMKGKSAA